MRHGTTLSLVELAFRAFLVLVLCQIVWTGIGLELRVCKVSIWVANSRRLLLPWVWLILLLNLLLWWRILRLCRPKIIRIELPLHIVLIIQFILHKAIFKWRIQHIGVLSLDLVEALGVRYSLRLNSFNWFNLRRLLLGHQRRRRMLLLVVSSVRLFSWRRCWWIEIYLMLRVRLRRIMVLLWRVLVRMITISWRVCWRWLSLMWPHRWLGIAIILRWILLHHVVRMYRRRLVLELWCLAIWRSIMLLRRLLEVLMCLSVEGLWCIISSIFKSCWLPLHVLRTNSLLEDLTVVHL